MTNKRKLQCVIPVRQGIIKLNKIRLFKKKCDANVYRKNFVIDSHDTSLEVFQIELDVVEDIMDDIPFEFLYDSGHGWLKVEKKYLTKLSLRDKITQCSYMDKKYVYLEEDNDMSCFYTKLKEVYPNMKPIIKRIGFDMDEDHCFVRDLKPYHS